MLLEKEDPPAFSSAHKKQATPEKQATSEKRETPGKRAPSTRKSRKLQPAVAGDGMPHDFVRPDVVRNVPDFVRVLNSPLHGFGIFAAMPLRRGTVVGQYQGTMSRECPVNWTFVMRVDVDDDDHFYVDASNPLISNFTRYINDPGPLCDGNCEFLQNDLFIQVVTRRAIDQNEELTAQYLDWHSPLGGDDAESDDEVVSIDALNARPQAFRHVQDPGRQFPARQFPARQSPPPTAIWQSCAPRSVH